MVTVDVPILPRLTMSGSEDGSIVIVNCSLVSNILSSVIGTSNEALVSPAVNVAV